ncbi:MAG: glycoside hydrolase family 2 TIM barrel-domain containing protein [Anaerolineae bacterium]|nr:glycoside hydrolase family 2 protein [Chloroflexota bacterium]
MARYTRTINRGWRFYRGDAPDAWFRGYDEASSPQPWREVTLPHDWAVSEPFSREHSSGGGYLPGGAGWYRGRFTLPEACRGKKVWLVFDGVYQNARVWANSYYLGKWPYGYTTFTWDISHAARFGDDDNQISVSVNHPHTADSRWFTGSGITRDVHVLVKDPVYFDQYGIFFTTPEVSPQRASVQVESALVNETDAPVEALVRHTLRDPDGRAVLELEGRCSLAAGQRASLILSGELAQPRLWAPGHPCLYTLESALLLDGTLSDDERQWVGIRSIRFDPDEGFLLNGERLTLQGVCVHHDAGTLGAAVHPSVWRRRLETLQRAGCNAIRMSHNPHAPALYDLCDRLGLLVIDEAFDEWEGPKNKWWQGHNVYPPKLYGYYEDFPAWHERDLSLLVRRDRNHPSVILWSIGNEIDYPNDPYGHPAFASTTGNNDANKPAAERRYSPDKPNAQRLVALAQQLKAIVQRWDTTRPVTAAVAYPEISNLTGYCDVLDVVGYNYKEQWYRQDHALYPRRPLLGSENGSHYAAWTAVRDNPFIAGQFLWTGIDYLGEARGWPIHGSSAGLLTTAGFEKAGYWFRRSLWLPEPVAHLVTARVEPEDSPLARSQPTALRRWARRAQLGRSWNYAAGELVEVICYTNCPEATLWLNGRVVASARLADFPEEGCLSWRVPWEPGILRVTATPAEGDPQSAGASDQLETTGPAVALLAETWGHEPLRADGEDVAQILLRVVDAAGRPVPGASPLVAVLVEGPAELLALDNGDLADNTLPCAAQRRALDGRLAVYLRSTGEAGAITVYCHAQGALQPATIRLQAVAVPDPAAPCL